MIYETRKLYCNCASVRSYIVEKCIKNKDDLFIIYEGEKMTVSWETLNDKFQYHKKLFDSKYTNIKYELFDFIFRPDSINKKQNKLI